MKTVKEFSSKLRRALTFLWRGGPACRDRMSLRVAEGAATFLLLAAAAREAFQRPPGSDARTYFVVPPLLWAAMRFGPRGALLGTLLLSLIATAYTTLGQGPFAFPGGGAEHLAALQGFLAVAAFCTLALATVTEDIRRAREDAAENRNRLDALLQRMPAILWTVDRNLRFTFLRGTLIAPEQGGDKLLGVSLHDFFGTRDPDFPALAAHRQTLAGEPAEYRQSWDGRTYECHVEPLRNGSGQVVGAVGVAQDVTAKLESEENRQRVQKMEALSRLASRTAHDFNNSLTAILGYCDLLLTDTSDSDPRRADIQAIETAAQRAAGTAERLTVFSRHHMNEARPVDLNALVQEGDAALGAALGPGIARVYRLEPGLPLVKLDVAQVREVLRQLALNAREAMPEGGQLVVTTQRRRGAGAEGRPAADGDHVRVTVHDAGPGLSEEARAHIFEPYYSTRSREKDKGLGLAVSYGLVRQNDGVITFQSASGKGTAFHLDFPLWNGGSPASPSEPAPLKEALRGSETLLLVEDEECVRTTTARILEGLGYTVLRAAGGREALGILQEDGNRAIRLLLSDVSMPGMNGAEVAREVFARRPDVRRLLMSGYAERSLLAEGTLPPGTAFLQKPFAHTALARRIRQMLDAHASLPT